jgi:hypothetical protein
MAIFILWMFLLFMWPYVFILSKEKGEKMFSPSLVRFILDPNNDFRGEKQNKKIILENHIFKFSILDFNKVKEDYNFFYKILMFLDAKILLPLLVRRKNMS